MIGLKSSFSEHQFLNVLVVILALYYSGCSLSKAQTQSTRSEEIKPSLQSVETKPSTPSLDKQLDGKDITKVDFMNFTYPVTEELGAMLPSQTFSIVEGGFSFEGGAKDTRVEIHHHGIIYNHVIGKGDSLSAIVVFSVASGNYGTIGTGRSHCVYIYSLSKGKLELLWSFDTGDRADGGLRNIYGANGNLIIETYKSDIGFSGACCAKTFMQSVYEWTGSRFKLIEAKRLNNPLGNASPMLGEHK